VTGKLLDGKSVVITGSGSGVGRAGAQLFAREGARVVVADMRDDWAKDTVALVDAEGGTAVAIGCNVVHEDDVAAAVNLAVEQFGRLDIMWNNVGISTPRLGMTFEDHTVAEFEKLLMVNGMGMFTGCRQAVLQFKRQGEQGNPGGVIVNTGSVAGMVGWGGVPYGSSKAIGIQMTRGLAVELAPHGIRVNCLCPGSMPTTNFGRTEGEEFKDHPDEYLDFAASFQPLGRNITPEDCANAALYLASDLSSNVTGVALPIDGGYIAK
jgi:NAD(P)-dependent dehydrogenase (short-subunit alcohol dehydrogenase family)